MQTQQAFNGAASFVKQAAGRVPQRVWRRWLETALTFVIAIILGASKAVLRVFYILMWTVLALIFAGFATNVLGRLNRWAAAQVRRWRESRTTRANVA